MNPTCDTLMVNLHKSLMSPNHPVMPSQIDGGVVDGCLRIQCRYRRGALVEEAMVTACSEYITACAVEYLRAKKWWKRPVLSTNVSLYTDFRQITVDELPAPRVVHRNATLRDLLRPEVILDVVGKIKRRMKG